jgi:DNA repair protein RecN (Recombination protein N)
MLQVLRIKNFAIIDELEMNFSKGFNVITGETGAGKSIILSAVHLLLGDKATDELIRSSEEEASIEALFDVSRHKKVLEKIKERDPKTQDEGEGAFVIRRVLSRSGRGKVFVNGHLATLGMLSEIGEELLSIYGQHEHQSLQRIETHIDILDEFGELVGLRNDVESHFEKWASLSEEVNRIRNEKDKRTRERDLMVFQSKEIEGSKIQAGEEEVLKEERRILVHAEKLMGFANLSEEAIDGEEDSALGRVQTILRKGQEVGSIDPSLSPLLKNLESIQIQLEEVALALRDYSKKVEINPARLEDVENRLEEIDRLKKKYGPTAEDILLFKKRIDEALQSFTSDEERLSQLEAELEPVRKETAALAEKLSKERKRTAVELKKSIEKELGFLGMKKTTFDVRIDSISLSSKGIDRIEFLISPNVGEEVKPLAKIASGGELSRIMLAMKRILARVGGRQVLIFDEVDSGIGGAVAEVVGRKLRDLSGQHQVICVTHLPQIACFADSHHSVRKEVKGGRTITFVDRLDKDSVVDEIARMLGGVKMTDKTRAHAREMIEQAKMS